MCRMSSALLFRLLMTATSVLAFGSAAQAKEPLILKDGQLLGPTLSAVTARPAIALTIDISRVLTLDRTASTIIIGNPGIANATLADNRTLVMTGKAGGTTNMIVLDETGAEFFNMLIRVGTSPLPHVKIYNGLQRHTYSCEPQCEPVIAIGDEEEYFQTVLTQTQARQEFSGTAGTGSP